MNLHEKADLRGREIVEPELRAAGLLCEWAKNPYDRCDGTFESENGKQRYVGDLKAYINPQYPRYSTKYANSKADYPQTYMVDYDKLKSIYKAGLNDGRKPILIVKFTDKLLVWDLSDFHSWHDTALWKPTNKDGQHYGQQEKDLMAFLQLSAAWEIKDGKWVRNEQ